MMKIKKCFCAKPNGAAKNVKKIKFPSNISAMKWRLSGNVRLFQKAPSKATCVGSFHQAIQPIIIFAQFFGVMPVSDVSCKCPSKLTFTWKSFRLAYATFVMLSCGLEAVSSIVWTFRTRAEFGKMVILVYYITNFLSFVCFLRLAQAWPELMVKWHDTEKHLPQMRTDKEKQGMCRRIRTTAVVILTLSACEHILSIVSSVAAVYDCPRIKSILQAYYVHNFPQVFSFFSYNHALGVYIKFIHLTSTFVWSYADLFIMMISCGLSAKFKQINERMMEDKGKVCEYLGLDFDGSSLVTLKYCHILGT